MEEFYNFLIKFFKKFRFFYNLFFSKSTCQVPFLIKVKLNLRGFYADRYVYYNFQKNDIKNYISDYSFYSSQDYNKAYHLIADNKLIFSNYFKQFVTVPKVYAVIINGRLFSLENKKFTEDNIYELMDRRTQLVIKPIRGGGGNLVHKITKLNQHDRMLTDQDNLYSLDKSLIDTRQLQDFIFKLDNFIITEHVKQHSYANNLFAKTVNTIRVITLLKPDNGDCVIPAAIHRIGRKATIPVDNFDKGGFSVEIDLETGILGRAASKLNYAKSTPIFFDRHPDNDAQITGVQIPQWGLLNETLKNLAIRLPYLPFIAWDIVITEEGFTVIEINKSSSVMIFQFFRGQKYTKLGEFYRNQGYIR